jgi:HAMP domain-containing protein
VARELRWWRDTDAGVAEIIATDARGRLIAATGKPTDVHQADEPWWRATFAGGRGRMFISDVGVDRTVRTREFEIAVPIYDDAAAGSRVVGVVKMSLDAPRLLESVRRARLDEGGEAMVIDHRGEALLPAPTGGVDTRIPKGPEFLQLREKLSGCRIFPGGDGGLLTAWARVGLEPGSEGPGFRMPPLYVITQRSAGAAFDTLRTVQFWMLLIGLTTVALAVAVGSWLADVLVIRQVRTLARGMRELARGDFARAEAIAARLCHTDEEEVEPEEKLAGAAR